MRATALKISLGMLFREIIILRILYKKNSCEKYNAFGIIIS
jgi:hypothetical protein